MTDTVLKQALIKKLPLDTTSMTNMFKKLVATKQILMVKLQNMINMDKKWVHSKKILLEELPNTTNMVEKLEAINNYF